MRQRPQTLNAWELKKIINNINNLLDSCALNARIYKLTQFCFRTNIQKRVRGKRTFSDPILWIWGEKEALSSQLRSFVLISMPSTYRFEIKIDEWLFCLFALFFIGHVKWIVFDLISIQVQLESISTVFETREQGEESVRDH